MVTDNFDQWMLDLGQKAEMVALGQIWNDKTIQEIVIRIKMDGNCRYLVKENTEIETEMCV